MDKEKKVQTQTLSEESLSDELENVEVGENHQERIVDHSERHKSLRHECKGPKCDTAFDKL